VLIIFRVLTVTVYVESETVYLAARFNGNLEKFTCTIPKHHINCFEAEITEIAKGLYKTKEEVM
jgi:hypothetical protein